jgi:hypothetical protein
MLPFVYIMRIFPLASLICLGAALPATNNGALQADPLPQLKLPYGTWQANSYDQDADVP